MRPKVGIKVAVNNIGVKLRNPILKRPGKCGYIGAQAGFFDISEQRTLIGHHIGHAGNRVRVSALNTTQEQLDAGMSAGWGL